MFNSCEQMIQNKEAGWCVCSEDICKEHKTARRNRLNPVLNLVCQKLLLVWRGNTVALAGRSSSTAGTEDCKQRAKQICILGCSFGCRWLCITACRFLCLQPVSTRVGCQERRSATTTTTTSACHHLSGVNACECSVPPTA